MDITDLLAQAKQEVDEVGPSDVDISKSILLDVREPNETELGYIGGAVLIPRGNLEQEIDKHIEDKQAAIVTYCATGVRSVFAAKTLKDLGYKNVVSLAGGITAWSAAGLDIYSPLQMTKAQYERYHRHLILDEVGVEGQQKLFDAKVLLLGAGGLGSPAAMYLAAAGVGNIGIIDIDTVDASNLHRQIMHSIADVGSKKTESAKNTILGLNPECNVTIHNEWLTSENVIQIISDYDIVVDGTDNFPTRYLLNDAAVLTNKPVIHGSIFRFEGQVTVLDTQKGPCYRCMLPEPPPPELAPSCAEAGVLGVLPGIVGSLQALETIKYILGIGDLLIGRILFFDSLEQSFKSFKVQKNPQCPACSPDANLVIKDYDQYCLP